MPVDEAPTVQIDDAKIIFRNFAGKEGLMNDKGDRNFCVILDPDTAEIMAKDGWNIKTTKEREEGEEIIEGVPFVPVKVNFKNFPPRIVVITASNGVRTNIYENSVETLDYADIKKVDLIMRGYSWAVGGKTGIKAYLKTMFVTINEDELERRYGIGGEVE